MGIPTSQSTQVVDNVVFDIISAQLSPSVALPIIKVILEAAQSSWPKPSSYSPLCQHAPPPPDSLGGSNISAGRRCYRTGAPEVLGFYSHYFTVPKKDGGLCPIMDLRALNEFITYRNFRMTTLQSILPLLPPGCWMVTRDLKDAYFHIAIKEQHQQFLRFTVGQHHFQYKVLSFGLPSAPGVFTKVVAVVSAHLRLQGVTLFQYINDWLLVVVSRPSSAVISPSLFHSSRP